MMDRDAEKVKTSLLERAPDIFGDCPVLFAYLYGSYATGAVHPFSDVDIGVYVDEVSTREYLKLELSLALALDEKLDSAISSDVRVINNLPVMLAGRIITEGVLLFSKNDTVRVDFETSVRKIYFDFFPVLQGYQRAYLEHIISGKDSLEK